MHPLIATDPRGGTPYRFAGASIDEVEAACASLRHCQATWNGATAEHRAQVLAQFGEALLKNRESLQAALEADTGRSLLAGVEIDACARRAAYWAKHAPQILTEVSVGVCESSPEVRFEHQRVPYPLIGVISPWNFPLLLCLTDALPALAAGCAVIAKPSEVTPRFLAPLQELVQSIPALAKVFTLVPGDGATGQAMIDRVDALCFTGSVSTGKLVGAQAGGRLIPAFLELGGKDPLIVLEDADLQEATAIALRAGCISTGQACQSIERVYVQSSLYTPFVEQLVARANEVSINIDRIDAGHIGPFIDPRQAEVVEAQLTDALARGATQHCGGLVRNPDGGVWCAPVVLTGVNHRMLVMREETFGPVVPVMSFDTDDEAVAMANDTVYGLSAAVLGETDHARAVALKLNAGAVSINDGSLTTQVSDVEKDSFGLSGVGRSRMGSTGLRRFLRTKALLTQTGTPTGIDAFAERIKN